MSSVNVSAQAVRQLIEQDIQTTERLSTLLQQEHNSLQQRDSQELNRIVADKQYCMTKLEQSAKQRGGWITFLVERTGMTPNESWKRLLEELKDPELPQLWDQLQESLINCKQHNEVNGKIITRGHKTLKQLLGILRGKSVETPRLYNASGDTSAQGQSHTVIKA